MKLQIVTILIADSLLTGCVSRGNEGVNASVVPATVVRTVQAAQVANTPTALGISPEAQTYLEAALEIMQKNSINRERLDWVAIRKSVFGTAQNAQTTADTYPAIRVGLKEMLDSHSFFMEPKQVAALQNMTVAKNPRPTGKIVENKLGYIDVPGFSGGAQDVMDQHTTRIQKIISELDAQSPCGWIIDLRENGGGNMWPMLAGLGPVLGEGTLGAFVDADGLKQDWGYSNGGSWLETQSNVITKATEPIYVLQEEQPPVAVLIGPRTASSGEAVVVAFAGRPNTRRFGQPTTGLSTGNSDFTLSDGAVMILTTVTFADRTGQIYGGKILPDETIASSITPSASIPDESINWLLNQPACSSLN